MVDIILRLIRFLMISMAFIINIFTYINWRKSIILESNQTNTQAYTDKNYSCDHCLMGLKLVRNIDNIV